MPRNLEVNRRNTAKLPAQHPPNSALLAAFSNRASNAPNDIVAIQDETKLSMGDLFRNAQAVAAAISRVDTGPEGVVGVFAFPGFELLSGLWGVLLGGAAYCPLSPDYPEDRLSYMIAQSQMQVIVCEAAQVDKLREICGPRIQIITLEHALLCDVGFNIQPALDDSNLAYVIFTSGSTGKPKGVMIEHRNIANQMAWFSQAFWEQDTPTILQKTPFSFDAAQWELLASAYGAKLIFGHPQSYRDPVHQIELVQKHDVTMLQCVPTLWRALLDTEKLHECRSLRVLFSGGEALPQGLAKDCLTTLPATRMINLYGPTECTINASSYEVKVNGKVDLASSAPIGYPVKGTTLIVLGKDGLPVTPGSQGELYIGGAQVGRGYIGQQKLTADRFVSQLTQKADRFYRTGDVVRQNEDGSMQFLSRVDGQIKLRGYRIELDEIRSAIENHDWVKTAGVFVRKNQASGADELVACVELSPNQAQLMDNGVAGNHHLSKTSKLQVKAQISQLGLMSEAELSDSTDIALPGKKATVAQETLAFGRKTYRHFKGKKRAEIKDICALLRDRKPVKEKGDLAELSLETLGPLLRNLGEHRSPDRLLPKYAYASPGALYPIQIFLEVRSMKNVPSGLYYYHPGQHSLHLMASLSTTTTPTMAFHFLGKNRAIEPVYKLNIKEVLEFEMGHIIGLLDDVLADLGLVLSDHNRNAAIAAHLGADETDHYIGSFTVSDDPSNFWSGANVTPYVQVHKNRVDGAKPGFYRAVDTFIPVSEEIVEKRHLVAINQSVMERAAFGIALCVTDKDDPLSYVSLGRALQKLQMNQRHYGFMSSGYSSRGGHDQRVVSRLTSLLGHRPDACYFCIGGRISEDQYAHRGMAEDAVHTKGPTELIRDDLKTALLAFMLPNIIKIVPSVPTLANGKVDLSALKSLNIGTKAPLRKTVAPRTPLEKSIAVHWCAILNVKTASVIDDFFMAGGDSLAAVSLISRLNKVMSLSLPLETLFNATTIAKLAETVSTKQNKQSSRLIQLRNGTGRPIFVWPGLGGYPMNLRLLAQHLSTAGRPIYGIQAIGLNAGEIPLSTVPEMALQDMALIQGKQAQGPYTLVGYSFGARVAFETTHQLEALGHRVENLVLAAPGNPIVRGYGLDTDPSVPGFSNLSYLAVLLSVFAQTTQGKVVTNGLRQIHSAKSFLIYVAKILPELDTGIAARIFGVARMCLDTTYRFDELNNHKVAAPITVLKARNDDYAFIESATEYSVRPPRFIQMRADHYQLLRPEGARDLAGQILNLLTREKSGHVAA